jgi:hypothetical protein
LAINNRNRRKGYSSAIDFFIVGMLLAMLILSLYCCNYFGTTSNRTAEQITTQLSEKYGKAFTVYALGDRIGKNTATAYVYADDDPTMIFVARVTDDGILEFESYAYRCVCRKVEDAIKIAFDEYGISSECYAEFLHVGDNIDPDMSIDDFIRYNSSESESESVVASIIVKTSNNITGENLVNAYNNIYEQLSGIRFGTGLYILTENDYNNISEDVKRDTQLWDAYRLEVFGAEDDIKEINILIDKGILPSIDEINAELSKEVN